MAGQVDQLLALVTALLGMALLIAVLGIMNTLALSIHERTHEIGLLRAVGMTRHQVRGMIRWEAVTIALLGAFVGLVLGIVFGWATTSSLAEEGLGAFVLPAGQLLGAVVLAALAGVLAAVLPARAAAKLDVLRAVTVE
jgi:putative ABC transport system permease protein